MPIIGFAKESQAYDPDKHVTEAWKPVYNALGTLPAASLLGWDDCQTAGNIVQAYEAFQVHRGRLDLHRSGYHPDVLARLETAGRISVNEYITAREAMTHCRRHAEEALGDGDAIVLPTCPVVAPTIGATIVHLADKSLTPRSALLRNTRVANYSGLTALTMPLRTAGLPVGIQIIGRNNDTVLRAGNFIRTLGVVTPSGRKSPPDPSFSPAWRETTENFRDA